MEKLNELIKEAEKAIVKVQEDVDRQKGLFDVSRLLDRIDMWHMRLGALNEAKALWREELERPVERLKKPKPGSVNIQKLVANNTPNEHDRKDVEVDGRKYAVAWEYTDIGDLCWMGDDGFPNKLFIMDMHAYALAYNYAWKVMHIYGEDLTPMEMRTNVDAFLDELSGWDTSIDPSEALYDMKKFCRSRNDAGEDVRHYLRELVDMLDGKTEVLFFQEGVGEMKEKTLALIGEMDAALAKKMVP